MLKRVVSGADVPFGDMDDNQLRLGVQTPKTIFWGREKAFQAKSAKNQIYIIFKTVYRISIKFDKLM